MTAVRAALAAFAAISTAAAQRGSVTTQARDSAGVEILTIGTVADSAGRAVETLRIGVASGDSVYELNAVGQITADATGRLFVVTGRELAIRVYGPDGKFIRTFGRRGRGPGEFTSVDRLWFTGDTLMVTDRQARRVSLFRADGTHLDTWALGTPDGGRAELLARTPSGWLAWVRPRSTEFSNAPLVLFRDSIQLRIHDPRAHTSGPILRTQPGPRMLAQAELYPASPLFEPLTMVTIGPDGAQYRASDGQYDIEVFDARGRLIRRISRALPRRPITRRDVEQLVARQRERSPNAENIPALEAAAKHPTAAAFQVLGALMVANDGSVFVQRIDDWDPLELELAAGFEPQGRTRLAESRGSR